MSNRNDYISFDPAPLGKMEVGQTVVVYLKKNGERVPVKGSVIKAARVNVMVEYEGHYGPRRENFRQDTQKSTESNSYSGAPYFRTVQQDVIDQEARKALRVLAGAGMILEHTSHLTAPQLVALGQTVITHKAFQTEV